TPLFRHLTEMRVKDPKAIEDLKPGDAITVDKVFKMNQRVDVAGITKGRGFAGVMKRHMMKGAFDRASMHEHHRHIGAVGQRKTPGKVWRNKRLPGHYGVENVTIQNLTVLGLEAEKNLLIVSGAIPGHADQLVFVDTAV